MTFIGSVAESMPVISSRLNESVIAESFEL